MRDIVRRQGWNATAYQILNPGFQYWLDPARDAAVGFVSRNRIRVVGGAPVCADDRLGEVLDAFESDARSCGEGVIYFCAEQRLAAVARRDGRRPTFPIGAQPVWHPADLLGAFSVQASLRAQLNRAHNKGIRSRELGEMGVVANAALRRCLDEWLDDRALPALHFLIETQTLDDLVDRRVFVAEREGELVGYLVASPIPARQGWLIEQIVRGRRAPNGTSELLLHHAARVLAERGAGLITLGLAPLAQRGTPAVDDTTRWLRILFAELREHGRRFYNFQGLENFKSKFGEPRWETVYASLAPGTSLPRALVAVAAAFAVAR